MQRIALLGGTFDPVHNGHIKTSHAIQQHFQFHQFIFLPCKNPVIKPASQANSKQRIDMLKLAIKTHQTFQIDLREIERDTPSYMVFTLESFKREYPDGSITLILGYDAFLSLPLWHQWEKILTLCHLLVITRTLPNAKPWTTAPLQDILDAHKTTQEKDLLQCQAGKIFFFNAGTFDISSTEIKKAIKANQKIDQVLPRGVYQYIIQQKLYQ